MSSSYKIYGLTRAALATVMNFIFVEGWIGQLKLIDYKVGVAERLEWRLELRLGRKRRLEAGDIG